MTFLPSRFLKIPIQNCKEQVTYLLECLSRDRRKESPGLSLCAQDDGIRATEKIAKKLVLPSCWAFPVMAGKHTTLKFAQGLESLMEALPLLSPPECFSSTDQGSNIAAGLPLCVLKSPLQHQGGPTGFLNIHRLNPGSIAVGQF